MKIKSCWGNDAKLEIVEKYNIKPVVYTTLLNGQKIDGCCGPITDKYYLFQTENKQTKEAGSFCVGRDCGEQFLKLINHSRISLFNPLQAEPKNQAGRNAGAGNVNTQQIAPLNKELSDAIQILCAAWGGYAPKGNLQRFLEYINSNPSRPTNSFAVVTFNRIVGKDAKGRTLARIIEDIRRDNPRLRIFTFPLMQQVLEDENQLSNL